MKKFRDSMAGSVIILSVICLVMVFALALTNNVTAPLIAKAQEKAADDARMLVLPEADNFTLLEGELPEGVRSVYKANNGAGYVFAVEDSGYGGALSFMVGMSPEGEYTGVTVLEHDETPGLGTKALEKEHLEQFVGKTDIDEVDDVTSATVSSLALKRAMEHAHQGYEFAVTHHADETTEASVTVEEGENNE